MPQKSRSVAKRATPYVKNAPIDLIKLHRRLSDSWGKDLLGRLLTHERMESAWREIAARVSIDPKTRNDPSQLYERLRREIFYAAARSGNADIEPRRRIRDRFLNIARDAKELAKALADGPLDLLAYALCANMLETPTPLEFTVEGGEEMPNGFHA